MRDSNERDEALQDLLPVLFEMLEKGTIQLGNVPRTIEALRKVRRRPDGTFDLSTVEGPVRALCWGLLGIAKNLPPTDWVPLSEFPEIQLPDIEKHREDEEDYLVDLVGAANDVRKYLAVVASVWPRTGLSPQLRPVLIGHAVRIFKLYDAVAQLLVENRGEIAMAILRMLADTVINMNYFLKHPTPQVVRLYVRQSLAYEKKLMEEVESRKRQPPLPIEEDMLRSIRDTFRRAGFEPTDVQADEWRGTSSLKKAKSVGLEGLYEFGFRPASHYVHGTWHDLEWNHLELVKGQFRPRLQFTGAKPQVLEMASVASLETAIRYIQFISWEHAAELIRRLEQLRSWFVEMAMLRGKIDRPRRKRATPTRGKGIRA